MRLRANVGTRSGFPRLVRSDVILLCWLVFESAHAICDTRRFFGGLHIGRALPR